MTSREKLRLIRLHAEALLLTRCAGDRRVLAIYRLSGTARKRRGRKA